MQNKVEVLEPKNIPNEDVPECSKKMEKPEISTTSVEIQRDSSMGEKDISEKEKEDGKMMLITNSNPIVAHNEFCALAEEVDLSGYYSRCCSSGETSNTVAAAAFKKYKS
ncbi:hypothetical protein ACH5RR_012437 [Cinchona calisaya]|uniref:Uncharacterized protein n=1 Tax=Cinchona calisaya TaxID=153742 RepID=A0ABD3A7Q7_9GENT